eukprot:11210679-Lingulodinium_polyedra.AAC.1
MNVLTLAEARANEPQVRQAMLDELTRWYELGAFQRYPRKLAKNVIDSRWVLKWKQIEGTRQIRARLTVRGFRDMQAAALHTHAGTTSRWGQRLVNWVAVQYGWSIFTADVSQAFLRGLTFKQVSELPGEVNRDVQFTVPPGAIPILRCLPGFANFDGLTE